MPGTKKGKHWTYQTNTQVDTLSQQKTLLDSQDHPLQTQPWGMACVRSELGLMFSKYSAICVWGQDCPSSCFLSPVLFSYLTFHPFLQLWGAEKSRERAETSPCWAHYSFWKENPLPSEILLAFQVLSSQSLLLAPRGKLFSLSFLSFPYGPAVHSFKLLPLGV